MTMTDPIADMLTRIRNAQKSKLITLSVPNSKMKCGVLNVLKEEGYIEGYEIVTERKISNILVTLKYSANGTPAICELKKMSKPGKRKYALVNELNGVFNGLGISILTTSIGIISDTAARRRKVGGEIICTVF